MGMTSEGGRCRTPGPSLSAVEEFLAVGRDDEGIGSPGSTHVTLDMVIVGESQGRCHRDILRLEEELQLDLGKEFHQESMEVTV
jgi:hypothetical protein